MKGQAIDDAPIDYRLAGGHVEKFGETDTGTAPRAYSRRVCILALGMHRSGTSALARAINLMGAASPKSTFPPDEYNTSGYWEPRSLNILDDQMIREAGSRWDDWRTFDPRSLSEERLDFYRRDIARLIDEEFGTAPLFVLKDPRISRFVPFYTDLLENDLGIEVRYALISRNPLSVASSLRNRDGFTLQFSSLLWLRHQLDAECATRHKKRVLVSYEALLNDWRVSMKRVAEGLGLAWPPPALAQEMLSTHFSTGYQHYIADEGALEANREIPDWVKNAYSLLRSLEEHPQNDEAVARLDAIRNAFDCASSVFEPVYSDLDIRQKTAAGQRHGAHEDAVALAALPFARQEIARLSDRLSEISEHVGRLNVEQKHLNERLSEATLQRDAATSELDYIRSSLTWRIRDSVSRLASTIPWSNRPLKKMSPQPKTAADIYVFEVDPESDTAAAHVLKLVGCDKDVLEIGAGPGSIARPLVVRNHCRVTALEADPKCIPILGRHCDKAILGDLNEAGWSNAFGGRKFDVVVIADVLEHLTDPWTTLREAATCLKPSGFVVSSIPNANHAAMIASLLNDNVDYRDWGLLDRTHIRFFGVKNIQEAFRQAGLKIVTANYVVRTPEATEFAENWAGTANVIRDALEMGPFSQVYQTVVKASLASSAGPELVLVDNPPPKLKTQSSAIPFVPPPHYPPGQTPTFRMVVGRLLGPTGRRVVKSILGIR